MRYPYIFFDLDGTLTDPTEGITKSVRYALSQFGIEAKLDDLRSFIGPPLHHSFISTYDFDEPKARLAVEHYREYFSEQGIYQNEMFAGIPALLRRLRDADAELCVVTSKPAVYSEQILRHFAVEGCFETVIAPGLDLADAEKTVLVRRAMDAYANAAKSQFVMIGDREHDVIGAVANGIDSVGVTYGAGSREELVAAGATHVVESLVELEALLLS